MTVAMVNFLISKIKPCGISVNYFARDIAWFFSREMDLDIYFIQLLL
jgi:hypothetical protein